jgi:hypothetical protein
MKPTLKSNLPAPAAAPLLSDQLRHRLEAITSASVLDWLDSEFPNAPTTAIHNGWMADARDEIIGGWHVTISGIAGKDLIVEHARECGGLRQAIERALKRALTDSEMTDFPCLEPDGAQKRKAG